MNTSLGVTLYTKEFGKVRLLFKGFEREKPLYLSRLSHFSLNEVVFYENRKSPYKIASECSLIEQFPLIRRDIKATGYALYLTELVDCLTVSEDINDALFELIFNSLKMLASKSLESSLLEMALAVRAFEVRLINSLGIKPGWGEWVRASNLSVSQGALNSLEYLEKETFDRLCRFKISYKVAAEVKDLVGSLLSRHLERPLKSQRWLEKIDALSGFNQ